VEEYNLIREDMGGTGIAINQDERHSSGYRCRGMQRIRTSSIGNIANFQGGLMSAQWVLHEPSPNLRRYKPNVGLVHRLHPQEGK
jgi:hypothetical protein